MPITLPHGPAHVPYSGKQESTPATHINHEAHTRNTDAKKNTIPRKVGRGLMGIMTGFVDSTLSALVSYYMAGMTDSHIIPLMTSACVASHISLGARRTCYTDLYFHVPHAISHIACSSSLYMTWQDMKYNRHAPSGFWNRAVAWLRDPLNMLTSQYMAEPITDTLQNAHITSNTCILIHALVDVADKELFA